MSMDNQLHKHMNILTLFASSDDHRLINNVTAELNNRSHGSADFRYIC